MQPDAVQMENKPLECRVIVLGALSSFVWKGHKESLVVHVHPGSPESRFPSFSGHGPHRRSSNTRHNRMVFSVMRRLLVQLVTANHQGAGTLRPPRPDQLT
jgi:hypothetical protein